MDVQKAIESRRSIRRFGPEPVARDVLERILSAAGAAPSAKNRQPWRFVVVQGGAKKTMLDAMAAGLRREKERALLPGSRQVLAGAWYTWRVMRTAPVTVFVLRPGTQQPEEKQSFESWCYNTADVQSVGAAIQNMLLAAQQEGLGSLWICDIFAAWEELRAWLGTGEQMLAAVSLGFAAQSPAPRPRNPLEDIVEWRE